MGIEKFPIRLKEIRQERGYTQEELAEIANVSVQTIRNYEQDRSQPVAEYLLILAEILDVTANYLLLGQEDMNKYTQAIEKELKQLDDFQKIKAIRDKELNARILPHLKLSEDLVTSIKESWESKKLFLRESVDDGGQIVSKESYATRNYVREIILRYCQNRKHFMGEFSLQDGMISKLNHDK